MVGVNGLGLLVVEVAERVGFGSESGEGWGNGGR